jgi:c-di-GMP-binding flagellar brake protein YcgR
MTELLADLVRREVVVPPPQAFRLSSAGVSFEYSETESVNEGDWVKISLFLLANVPRPLEFAGRVVSSNPDFVAENWLTVSFEQINEVVESALDRLVFKHHRREVAMRRANREGNE